MPHRYGQIVKPIARCTLRKILAGPSLFEAHTPERLIAGIGAGLSLGLMMEIVLVAWEGSAYVTGGFSGYWCGS